MVILTFIYWITGLLILFYILFNIKGTLLILINLHQLSGPPSDFMFIGNIRALAAGPDVVFQILRQWCSVYYPIYKLYLLHIHSASMLSPEDFALILSNSQQNTKSPVYDLLLKWLKTGLLTSTGDKWLKRRKILTPAFHFRILQDFILVFNEETDKLVENLRNDCHKSDLNVVPYVDQFTLTTIIETAMGTKLQGDNSEQITYKSAIHEIGMLLLYRLTRPWLMSFPDFIYYYLTKNGRREKHLTEILHNFTKKVINERRKDSENLRQLVDENFSEDEIYSERKRLAMLDLLFLAQSEKKIIDDEGIREEVDTFMFKGHDTTAMALSFALMLLACNKNIQD